jgi:hypothetical protein
MSNTKAKSHSPLVLSVLTLDAHLADLDRLGAKIESLEMESDFDFEQAQKNIELFSKAGEAVSAEIGVMAKALHEARQQAENIATMVAGKAEILHGRKVQVQQKMEELRELGENVKEVTSSLGDLRQPEGQPRTAEAQAMLTARLTEVDMKIRPLIEKAQALKKEAQDSKMKVLEQSADSLSQSLTAISQKLTAFQQAHQPSH